MATPAGAYLEAMKKLALVVVAALVLGLGLWQLVPRDDAPPATGLGPASSLPEEAGGKRSAPRVDETAPAEAPAPEPARTSVEVEPAAPVPFATDLALTDPDPEGTLFEVVLGDGETPLPGALLSYLGVQRAASGGAEEIMASGGGIDAVLDQLGQHYRCDERGQVRIGDLEVSAFLRARGQLGGKRYFGMNPKGEGETRVVVEAEAGFEVTVVDLAGEPIEGAEVQYMQERLSGQDRTRMALASVVTDGQGKLFLPNVMKQLGDRGESMMARSGARALASLSGYYIEPPEVELDWREADPAPIQLVRPDVGRVVVHLFSAEGAPQRSGRVLLTLPHVPPHFTAEPFPFELLGFVDPKAEPPGQLVFDNVQTGFPFDLALSVDGSTVAAMAEGLVVPAGQTALAVELRAESAVFVLSGRVVHEDGSLASSEEVLFGERSGSSWGKIRRLASVRTDADGAFRIDAPWAERKRLVAYQLGLSGGRVAADLVLPSDLDPTQGGNLDLGSLTLLAPELLVSGRIVDAAGKGVAVPLLLETRIPNGPDRAEMQDWQRWVGMSHPDGSFELRGTTGITTLKLEVTSEQFARGQSVAITRGQTGVVVKLPEPAHFRYQLPELDNEVLKALVLSVPAADPDGRQTSWMAHELRSPPLAAGLHPWRLFVSSDWDHPVAEGDVHLDAGDDVDLGMITFARELHHYVFHITVVGDHDPRHLEVMASRQVEVTPGVVETQWVGMVTKRPDGTRDLVTLDIVEEVNVRVGDSEKTFVVVEGDNQLTLVVE
jgi:hypothetical protein